MSLSTETPTRGVPAATASPQGIGHPPRGARFALRRAGVTPLLALLACAVRIGCLRASGWVQDRLRGGERAARRAAREARAARILADTLGRLKGPYAKLGQFASLRHDVLPEAWRGELAPLRDRVPPLPFELVREQVERELGTPLEGSFARFDPAPLGAASIAQAHRADLPDGRPVVVKVQYPWLEGSLPTDLAILRTLLGWVARRRSAGHDRLRWFDEFASGVREELDFEREARAAREIAENLAGDERVVVPEVIASHSTRRLLTVVHHEAVPITDRAALRRLHVDPAEVLEILVRAYARQIFVDGHFHADPHPGNLFVLAEPEAPPRILFVDFGLSRQLAPELREQTRQAIFALLQGDTEAFLARMTDLDMIAPGAEDEVRAAVARMVDQLRAGGSPLGLGAERVLALKDEALVLLRETPGLQLPNDLLLYARTLSYVFSLGRELAPEVDLMKLTVPWLLRFLATAPPPAPAISPEARTGAGPAAG